MFIRKTTWLCRGAEAGMGMCCAPWLMAEGSLPNRLLEHQVAQQLLC